MSQNIENLAASKMTLRNIVNEKKTSLAIK
jgi:hypothetical protein